MQLSGVPTPHGLALLKQQLYNKIKYFSLIDAQNKRYYTAEVHSVFFDSAGVLSVVFLIPKEQNFTYWNKYVEILDDKKQSIIKYETPQIQFVYGVGGEQIAKLPLSGKAENIVFKKDDYLTQNEFEDIYLARQWYMQSSIHLAILKQEIREVEIENAFKEKLELLSNSVDKVRKEASDNIENIASMLFGLIAQNQKAILKQEIREIK